MTTSELEPNGLNRRSFLRATGVTAGATLLGSAGLQALTARMAEAAPRSKGRPGAGSDYGPLEPLVARNTGDPLAGAAGRFLLHHPHQDRRCDE